MKIGKNVGMSTIAFGITGVQSGQKTATVNAEPQLEASSTPGKFSITAAVSKALGIAVGEKVMFLNNAIAIDAAIKGEAGYEELKAWADENGVDITTPEGRDTVMEAFVQWFIAKGVLKYDKNVPVMTTGRVEVAEKEAYLNAHRHEIMEANRAALVELLGDEDATDEELENAITVDMVVMPTYHDSFGSKTATTSSSTGIGLPLNFTDSVSWLHLKDDLSVEERTKLKRVFDVDINNPINVKYDDGTTDGIEVNVYAISYNSDKEVTRKTKKDTNETQAINGAEVAE